jgi:glycosyltransferase involved in cell wall biosynthesis
MLRAASAIITGSRHTAAEVPAEFQTKCIYLPENAVDLGRFDLVAAQKTNGPLRACFIGRLVPYKGPDILLEAAAGLLQSGKLTLDFIGDGPMMRSLRNSVAELGIEDSVTFHGWQEHKQVQTIAVQSNLLTFPSIREFGGGVVLEAMALGVVPVIVDYAGPGELVDEQVGFKVPIGTRDQIIADYRTCLEEIVANPRELAALSKNARNRVNTHFTWGVKARQVLQVYNWLKDRAQEKPRFF